MNRRSPPLRNALCGAGDTPASHRHGPTVAETRSLRSGRADVRVPSWQMQANLNSPPRVEETREADRARRAPVAAPSTQELGGRKKAGRSGGDLYDSRKHEGEGILDLQESSRAHDAMETFERGARRPFGASSLRDRDELSRQERTGSDPKASSPSRRASPGISQVRGQGPRRSGVELRMPRAS
jgi:hypothetical protein